MKINEKYYLAGLFYTLMKSTVEISRWIEDHLAKLQLEDRRPESLYEPLRYLLALGGKRVRPLMLLLTYQAFTDAPLENAMPFAVGIEAFHNFTLVHDDIMDNAPDRRGQPTLHVKWNTNTAILSGDALFAYTYVLFAERINDPYFAPVLKLYNEVVLGVCEGQMMDLEQAETDAVAISDYLEMIRKKTAVLIGGAMAIGATAGGAETNNVKILDSFGQQIGIAFQLKDDLLDLYADAEKFGKQTGGDIYENKRNFLYLKALEKGSAKDQAELKRLFNQTERTPEKLASVRQIYDRLGIRAETEKLIQQYHTEAMQTIAPLADIPGIRQLLEQLNPLMNREH